MALFRATKVQVATYLLAICPFSIAFLVFLNSSVSFVVTDLIGLRQGQGDAVGTLGFADELLALAACPAWGLLSDRLGVRAVCFLGYLIIALALVLFVQSKNVYPQLLLGRLFFSLGGAAATTMVTAILPAVASEPSASKTDVSSDSDFASRHRVGDSGTMHRRSRVHAASVSSDATITPTTMQRDSTTSVRDENLPRNLAPQSSPSSSRVAGFVGLFTGVGALIALTVFLPLPARFQDAHVPPAQAIQNSYYIVAGVALAVSLVSYFGLSGLKDEAGKGLIAFIRATREGSGTQQQDTEPFWTRLGKALLLGVRNSQIGLGYVGGFVARASSVGISLFIPLAINAQFRSNELCTIEALESPAGLPDIKQRCPRAYTLAAELTGVSQLIALLAAPAFGYLSSRYGRRHVPLLVGALSGIIGYVLFAVRVQRPRTRVNGDVAEFIAMAFIGLSQIAAIVCSLGLLSDGILQQKRNDATSFAEGSVSGARTEDYDGVDETAGLISGEQIDPRRTALKGSVAGIYSLYGGAGILLLTKLGGALFDRVSFGSPFYIMAVFNGILAVACVLSTASSAFTDSTNSS